MDHRVIQLIAALNNPRSRLRFAAIALSNSGLAMEPGDQVLLQSGVIADGPDGVAINPEGLSALLIASRQTITTADTPLLDRVPTKRGKRIGVLTRLTDEVFIEAGEALSESELGERLSERVSDVALFRRALVDHGFISRDPAGRSYRVAPQNNHGELH